MWNMESFLAILLNLDLFDNYSDHKEKSCQNHSSQLTSKTESMMPIGD